MLAKFITKAIMEPGVTDQFKQVINITFGALLALLAVMAIVTKGNKHFIILFIIAACLYGTLLWFLAELKNVKLLSNEKLAALGKEKGEKFAKDKLNEFTHSDSNEDIKTHATDAVKNKLKGHFSKK